MTHHWVINECHVGVIAAAAAAAAVFAAAAAATSFAKHLLLVCISNERHEVVSMMTHARMIKGCHVLTYGASM